MERKISSVQLALLLFLCSLASLLISSGSFTAMAAFLPAMVFVWAALVPAFLLGRRQGFLPALSAWGKGAVIPAALLLVMVCLFMAAQELRVYGFFLTSTVYPKAQMGIFLVGTGIACAYAAGMGLEPLARLGLWASVFAAIAFIALALGLMPSVKNMPVFHVAPQEMPVFFQRALGLACASGEALLFLILAPRARSRRKQGRKGVSLWLSLTAAAAIFTGLLSETALGAYRETRRYPLHTAAAAAHFSPQGRMDLLFLFLYTGAVFVKISLWLYGGCLVLRYLFPRARRGLLAFLCGAGAVILGFLPFTQTITDLLLSGWVLAFVFIAPWIPLLFFRKGERP